MKRTHLDHNGRRRILHGDIVTVHYDDWYFRGEQGLVVNQDNGDPEYAISVFYNVEVQGYGGFANTSGVYTWDRHIPNWKLSNEAILSDPDFEKKCPRIVTYKPTDLTVCDQWNLEKIVMRGTLPGGACWQSCTYKDRPFVPGLYECENPGCSNLATEIAWMNSWGTLAVTYVCKTCFPEIHALRTDSYPARKEPLPPPFSHSPWPRVIETAA